MNFYFILNTNTEASYRYSLDPPAPPRPALSTPSGLRCSSAVAYLNGTFQRPNLDVVTDSLVSSVEFGSVEVGGEDASGSSGDRDRDRNHDHGHGHLRTVDGRAIATGVRLSTRDESDSASRQRIVRLSRPGAGAEVVLAAGAIGSPHILALSGIGDPATSERIGLGQGGHHGHVVDLPGVGRNLQVSGLRSTWV